MPIKPLIALVVILGAFLAAATAMAATNSGLEGKPPRSVIAGQPYYYQPQLDETVDGQLSYHITNRPSWAKFWTGSGRLFGTPQATDIGTYNNIRIEARVDDQRGWLCVILDSCGFRIGGQ